MTEDTLTENAKKILKERYLKRDRDGNIVETPEELFERVASTVAKVNNDYDDDRTFEDEKEEFYDALTHMDFIPNSPTLMNAGLELGQLSACFVLSPLDDMDSIFQQVKNAAKIFQSGGGVGYTFSRLRPRGDTVKSTGGVASGPVSFMRVYDEMCNTIKQGGKRRGAQMGILSVQHPDIEEFITAKDEEDSLNNFNISVG
ncbi:MAG: ribonucleotide reductase N-terminal alpha domain-containing protein, partial [Candidatus Saliniplasma sp.]